MEEVHTVPSPGPNLAEPLTFVQQEVLERAIAKIVALGELVGVSADQMILLLESGLTVSELLEYLGARTRQALGKQAATEVRVQGLKGD